MDADDDAFFGFDGTGEQRRASERAQEIERERRGGRVRVPGAEIPCRERGNHPSTRTRAPQTLANGKVGLSVSVTSHEQLIRITLFGSGLSQTLFASTYMAPMSHRPSDD
ncbi:hypothetical protein BHE74_00003365 [Ensete ventricosum]|nr:hypothetical protein BHE74_00003365 [Ensete ventricosum]RZR76060.1 hypothetical protein BHM03_00000665 [Ensete ventricosum]